MKKLAIPLLGLMLLATTACKHDQRPADVLDAAVMADFLTDLYLIEGQYAVESQYRFDAASPEILGACSDLLEKHHITRERVEKSFDYYSQHPEEYKSIQTEVVSRLEKLNGPNEESPLE
jgi:hypothetical protein